MIWIVVVVITILALVTVSFIFGSSTYSSMPGAKVDSSVLGEDELIPYQQDKRNYAMIKDSHDKAIKLVKIFYNSRPAPKDTLLQAVKCYEGIRNDANSAVVELNLAILTKARIEIEHEGGASTKLIQLLKKYFDTALDRADFFLKQNDHNYESEVKSCRKKLVKYNDAGK